MGRSRFCDHPSRKGYELDEKFSGNAQIEYDQDKALQDADFVYVKNWSSYKDYGKITCTDPSWMFTNEKLKLTNAAKVMHCLPVRRNVVIADEVLDGRAIHRYPGSRQPGMGSPGSFE